MRVSTVTKMAVAIILPLFLAACIFIPGKFSSTMTVEKNGKFSFAYKGEIFAMTSDTMGGALDRTPEEFEPFCSDGEDGSRDCTPAEVTKQRKEWDAGAPDRAKAAASRDAQKGEAIGEMMGFNPNDPKSVEAFAAKLRQQKGWRSVVHKGDGVFEVDYAISGTLDRDFIFPNIPGVKFAMPFVVAPVRNDNNVFIEAPLFGPSEEKGAHTLMGKTALMESSNKSKGPAPDGTFTISTNADILTNNTNNGPQSDGGRAGWRTMSWPVTENANKAPETLLRIQP